MSAAINEEIAEHVDQVLFIGQRQYIICCANMFHLYMKFEYHALRVRIVDDVYCSSASTPSPDLPSHMLVCLMKEWTCFSSGAAFVRKNVGLAYKVFVRR